MPNYSLDENARMKELARLFLDDGSNMSRIEDMQPTPTVRPALSSRPIAPTVSREMAGTLEPQMPFEEEGIDRSRDEIEGAMESQKEVDKEKKRLANIGALADAATGAGSFGEFFLGKFGPRSKASDGLNAMSNALPNPLADRAKIQDLLAKNEAMKGAKAASDYKSRTFTANTPESRAAELLYRTKLAKQGINAPKGLSAEAYEDIFGKSMDRQSVIDAAKASRDARPQDPDRGLPTEAKETISKLSGKDAGKLSISTQIEAVMDGWDKLDDNAKLQQGRQLIKVLNSTEGQDAVGAEEARRLAGKLEIGMGGLLSGNTGQFGRDLEGFKNDAITTANNMRGAIKANQKIIQQVSGRKQPSFDRSELKAQAFSDAEKEKRYQEWKQRRGN